MSKAVLGEGDAYLASVVGQYLCVARRRGADLGRPSIAYVEPVDLGHAAAAEGGVIVDRDEDFVLAHVAMGDRMGRSAPAFGSDQRAEQFELVASIRIDGKQRAGELWRVLAMDLDGQARDQAVVIRPEIPVDQ